jgi:hypothetical protein
MHTTALHPVPRRADVALEQVRAVGMSLRREGAAAAGVLALVGTVIAWDQLHGAYSARVDLNPGMLVPAAVLALLLPVAVWKGEGPERRGYHHAMPVDRGVHAVTRTLAGLAWMLAALGAYFGWLALAAALTGGFVREVPAFRWVAPVTGAVVLYLLGSALALRVAHPWRWLGGAAVVQLFLRALAGPFGDGLPLYRALDTVVRGRFGIATVATGLTPEWVHRATFAGRDVVYAHYFPVFGSWLLATWVWLAIAITLFLWAAYRQPEQ